MCTPLVQLAHRARGCPLDNLPARGERAMTTRVSIDGDLCEEGGGSVSVMDRGFLYGDSVYEVMRTYGGALFAPHEHLDRLERSAALLGIRIPLAHPALLAEIRECVSAAANAESYIRVIITRGAGPIGLDPALASDPCRVVIVTALQTVDPQLYVQGARVALIGIGRSSGGDLPAGAKSGNYLTNLLALQQARQHGAHEALMLDTEGRICEGSTSNVFAVLEGSICTPPLEVGILEGITRSKVMTLARQLGYTVRECQISPEQLASAEEVFLTSTIREVLPVTVVDDTPISAGRPGPVTDALRKAFQRLTHGASQASTAG